MTMTTASLESRAHTGDVTDDDIDPAARPTRRSFSAEYKTEILAEYDAYPHALIVDRQHRTRNQRPAIVISTLQSACSSSSRETA